MAEPARTTTRYFRKDYVEAEQQENGDWFITRYDIASDQMSDHILVPDEAFQKFFLKDEAPDAQQIPEASSHDGGDSPRLETAGHEQNGTHPSEGGQGVQQGGRGFRPQTRPEGQQEVAAAYAVTVDGFIRVPTKAVRNPESPCVVWMKEGTWTRLATHASPQGIYYIPCGTDIYLPADLHMVVWELENPAE